MTDENDLDECAVEENLEMPDILEKSQDSKSSFPVIDSSKEEVKFAQLFPEFSSDANIFIEGDLKISLNLLTFSIHSSPLLVVFLDS